MKMNKLSKTETAAIKRIYSIVHSYKVKREKLIVKKEELETEIDKINQTISKFEDPVIEMTGGYDSEQYINMLNSPEEAEIVEPALEGVEKFDGDSLTEEENIL